MQGVDFPHHFSPGQKSVAAFVGHGGMALCAGDAHFEPERAFFGHFDGVAPARARIRHDIEILRPKSPAA